MAYSIKHGRGTILLVEDEPILRMVLADQLAELGYRTIEASDGLAALQILRGTTDLALLMTDVDLPGLDGRALATEARRLRPRLAILFSTGDSGAIRLWSGFDPSIMSVVGKPLSLSDLVDAIDLLVEPETASG